jgi:hypothetical protein
MAFQLQNFSRSSMSANERIADKVSVDRYDEINLINGYKQKLRLDSLGTFGLFHYFSKTYTPAGPILSSDPTGDSITNMMVPGYFNDVASAMQQGDVIDAYSYKDSSYARFTVLQTYADAGSRVALVPNVVVKLTGPVRTSLLLSVDKVRTLNTKAVTILGNAATNNCLIYVYKAVFSIAAGTAYAGGGEVSLNYDGAAETLALSANVPANFFTANTQKILGIAPSINVVSLTGPAPANNNLLNNEVILKAATADFTAGDRPLYVELESNIYSF